MLEGFNKKGSNSNKRVIFFNPFLLNFHVEMEFTKSYLSILITNTTQEILVIKAEKLTVDFLTCYNHYHHQKQQQQQNEY